MGQLNNIGAIQMVIETIKEKPKKLKLNPPIIIVNFKAYREAIGENAIRLSEIVEDVANEYDTITFAVAPQPTDIFRVAQVTEKTLVFAQHIDPVTFGAFTGNIPPEVVKLSGASGTLINHSEKPLPDEIIRETINRAKETELITVVCAGSISKVEKVTIFMPNYVAYEPPELIGTGISVSRAQPEILREAVKKINELGKGKVIPLCGAGISNKEDVIRAFELGVNGILVSSAIVKAKDPCIKLQEFADGILEYLETIE